MFLFFLVLSLIWTKGFFKMSAAHQKTGFMSEEERAVRDLRARRRFKAVVRLVIANNAWLTDAENQEEGGVSDNVARNIHMLTRKKRTVTGNALTLTEKSILRKPLIARTKEETLLLRKKLGDIKAFRRFPQKVKFELPTVMFFVYYEAGRQIIRQGDDPINMYVILSGEVLVSKKFWNYVLKCEEQKDLATLGAGSIFGQVSLMDEDVKRTATVTTLTGCELLYLSDDDFERVLKSTVKDLWNEIRSNMSLFRYFDKLNALDIRDGCMLGQKKTYHEDQIILMDRPDHRADNVFFIIKGLVHMFEYMLIGTGMKYGQKVYKLLPEKCSKVNPAKVAKTSKEIKTFMKQVDDAEKRQPVDYLPKGMTAKWHFFKICSYRRLGSFNLGESFHNRLIVARSDVECLILPRHYLDEKCDVTFKAVEMQMIRTLPSTEDTFQWFLEQKAWTRYKEALVKDIVKRRNIPAVNTISNVPYSIRLNEDVEYWLGH